MDAVGIDTAEDANEDTIEETVPELCRVCLIGHMIMRDLFVENDVVSLSTKAMSFASVKMLPEDGLPTQVCCECADKLEAAYEFKLQVEQADNILRQRYDTLNIKEELFFNEVEVHLEAERGDDVHSLDVEAHYQATVDSLNAIDGDDDKPTLLKDHLALLEVEKLAKQQSALQAGHKHDGVMSEEAGVSAMLRPSDEDAHYLHESEDNVVELADCNEDYRESVKAESIQDPDGITAEEHNYIMQQGYTLTRNVEEELVTQASIDSVDNDSVHYLSMLNEELSVKGDPNQSEILNTVKTEEQQQEQTSVVKNEILPREKRRSKRRLNKRLRNSDEESYFENLNLSSRLKKTQLGKSEKFYFLCYICDKKFVSKEVLKDHMRSQHEEVRRTLSLKKVEKTKKLAPSPLKAAVAPIVTTYIPPIAGTSLSGKKANKCPYCGKEYLYVISFNKHLKQHEKSKENTSKDSSLSQEESIDGEAEDSSDFVGYDEARESEANNRIEACNDDDNDDDGDNDDDNDGDGGDDDDDDDGTGDGDGDGDGGENDENLRNETLTSPSRKKQRRRSLQNDGVSYNCEKFANKRNFLEHSNEHFTSFKCNTCDREFDGLEKLRRHRTEHVVEGVLSQQDLENNVYAREFDQETPDNDSNDIYTSGNLVESDNIMEAGNQQDRDNEQGVDDTGVDVDNENTWRFVMEGDNIDHEEIKDIRISEISENWPDPKSHRCPNCTITCSSKKSLARHMERHEIDGGKICKLCKMEFSTRDELEEHVVQQQHACRTKFFKCTDCGKIFNNELTLRNHLFATDHKTTIHGQQYDPNKRIKRVAAKAAQRIIDRIKTEDDSDDYEEDVKGDITVGHEELSSRNCQISNVCWTRQDDNTVSARKIQQHRNRRRYECESCGRKCSSKQSLTKHMEQHRVKDERNDNSEKFEKLRRNNAAQVSDRSGFCNARQYVKTTNFRRDQRIGYDTDNDETSDFESGLDWPIDNHECPTCKKKYSTKKSLLRHQLLHEEPNFECDICSVKFYRKDKLKSHYDKCSEKNPDQVRKCNICGDTFENNDILKEHRSRHVDEGILTEEDLREIEPGTDERRESTKVARKRRTDIVGLECTECNKRYTSRKGLLRHIQVHEGKKYLCDICPKKFYRREHLKIHVAKHNMIKPYKCPRCTKRFIKEEQLSNHLSKHDRTFKKPKETDTSKRFLCEICSKSFTQSTTLIAHLRAHNGIKPYVCEVCARPFTTNAYLKMHMRTHTQERPYSCQYCSRAFARADTLANHLTSHTGEAKYHCKYCPKNFRRLKSLKEHVFIHTGQRPYACPTCDRRFNNNGSRYAHSKRCKQNLMQNPNRGQSSPMTSPILQNTTTQPIRLHQLTGSHQLMTEHEEHETTQMQMVKSQSIKTITIARASDQLAGHHQMMQHQEILMPLILPLTVTLRDVDDEVILPEDTKIYTTA